MQNKIYADVRQAIEDIHDGATVLIGGFSGAGIPEYLLEALIGQGSKELTIVHNNAGNADNGVARLLKAGQVRKVICSFPRSWESYVFEELYRAGKVELECVAQGTLAERLRAGGSGLGGFFTPTGFNTEFAKGKETRMIDGRGYVLESPITGDFALVKADKADRWGNLQYRMTARNFGPVMCMAAKTALVEVNDVVPLGMLNPEAIVTSGAFVQRIVKCKERV